MDDEGYSENSDSSSSNNRKNEEEASDGEEEEDFNKLYRDPNGRLRLFKFAVVNSYGSAEMEKIKDDGKPIKISSEWMR